MPPRKKETQLGLGETPKVNLPPAPANLPPAVPVAAMVEYQVGAETWLCKRMDALVAELPGLTVALLPRLQAALELQDRQWLIARRLFGMMPSLPPKKYPLDDLRVWAQEELAAWLTIDGKQWQMELQAIRGIWEANKPVSAPAEAVMPPTMSGLFSDEEILKRFDMKRIRFNDIEESVAFVKRVRDMEKLLEEKMTSGLARNLLMTELQLRRLDETLTITSIQGDDWRANMKMRGTLDATYNDQLKQIDKIAPWAGAIAGKYSFKGTLSEMAQAYQKYYAEADNQLIDGIFTSTEVQVLTRRSVQAPEPQYRAGWVVHALAAKANLWNPAWRNDIEPRVLKRMDVAFKEAIKAAGMETGETLADLEKDGPGGEYAPLMVRPVVGQPE